jgi:hypothetical protein
MTTRNYYSPDRAKRAWYDRSTRSWILQHLDAEGNQLGSAEYCAHKQSAMAWLNS